MVKYACKVTSCVCLRPSFTAVHEDIPKCMPKNACTQSLSCSFSRVRIPPYAIIAYRQWIGKIVLRDVKKTFTRNRTQERLFRLTVVIIRPRAACLGTTLSAMQTRPCLKTDTVSSPTVPKDFFPHRAEGGTQIFSRRLCMNDSDAIFLPLRRIT